MGTIPMFFTSVSNLLIAVDARGVSIVESTGVDRLVDLRSLFDLPPIEQDKDASLSVLIHGKIECLVRADEHFHLMHVAPSLVLPVPKILGGLLGNNGWHGSLHDGDTLRLFLRLDDLLGCSPNDENFDL